jgi:peptidyl-prolyl cis-trans isomerase B (cyclophilin B)
MVIAALLLLACPGQTAPPAQVQVKLRTPAARLAGEPYRVELELDAPAGGARLEGWQLTPAAFTADGQPLAEKGGEPAVELASSERKIVELDLTALLPEAPELELAWCSEPPVKVRTLERAPQGLEFLDEAALPAAELARYWVLLRTNRGDVLLEFWPDVAPNHVRNFLDLASSGFYDDLTFHRIIPGFMIQGGDPDGNGTGSGPRKLKLEPSDRKHERGVLSMARGQALDSASCQFFIMHTASSALDRKYSAFGQVVSGMYAVDRIVKTPRDQRDRPRTPQVIEKAFVLVAPADPAAWREPR